MDEQKKNSFTSVAEYSLKETLDSSKRGDYGAALYYLAESMAFYGDIEDDKSELHDNLNEFRNLLFYAMDAEFRDIAKTKGLVFTPDNYTELFMEHSPSWKKFNELKGCMTRYWELFIEDPLEAIIEICDDACKVVNKLEAVEYSRKNIYEKGKVIPISDLP